MLFRRNSGPRAGGSRVEFLFGRFSHVFVVSDTEVYEDKLIASIADGGVQEVMVEVQYGSKLRVRS